MNTFSITDLSKRTGAWLKGTGPDSDIVISSRVRLARNVNGFVFSPVLSDEHAVKLLATVTDAIGKSDYLKQNCVVPVHTANDVTKQFLLERHLISRELAEGSATRAVSFSTDESVSIMINEEDHMRLQVLQSGFTVMETWRIMDMIESQLEKVLPFSFHQQIGYLTACPTNVGTGLRASCMLHVPSLVMTKQINKVLQAVAKLNLAVRGLYGEGTQASGNFFQFSNQVTLGKNEETIIEDLEKVIKQIIEHEREARLALNDKKKEKLHDQIWRAVGTLKAARMITSQEATSLLSLVRLGVDLTIIKDLTRQSLNELFIAIQPAHLQVINGKVSSPAERDVQRAERLRTVLKNVAL